MITYKCLKIRAMLLICFIAVLVVLSSGHECDKHGILVYEDLGCTAQYGNDKQCPIKYSCQGLESSNKHCYFKGKSYKNREQVDNSLSSPSCNVACFCSTDNGRSSFTCAILDCPEWLGPTHPGCYWNYTLEHCCSVGQICTSDDDTQKCVVEGKEYKEGQKFYPSNTCLVCLCQKGFDGKFEEPFCKKRSCGVQLRQSGSKIQENCAPFYSKQFHTEALCCPDDWICPNESETFEGTAKSDEICKFGKKTLKVGQYFEKSEIEDGFGRTFKKVKCECAIPPLVTCRDV